MVTRTRKQNLRIELELSTKGGQFVASIKNADDALGKLDVTTKKTGRSTRETTEETQKYTRTLNRLEPAARNAATAMRAFIGFIAVREIIDFGRALIDISAGFSTAQSTLQLVTGTAGLARAELGLLFDESQRLGTEFRSTSESFAQFAAGVRGSSLDLADVREIFTGVSEAAAVLNISAEDTSGIFRALIQSVSGGVVQLEEINQISERLGGTFGIADRAVEDLGGSIRELTRDASLAGDEFALRFARQLREEFGEGVPRATERAAASFNRLFNELQLLGASAGGVVDFVASISEALAGLVGWVRETLQGVGILRELFADVPGTIEETRDEITRLESELESLDESMRRSTSAAENSVIFGRQQEILKRLIELRKQLKILEAAAGDQGAAGGIKTLTRATDEWNEKLEESNILLLNSGRQYQALNEALANAEDQRIKNNLADQQKIDLLEEELDLLRAGGDALFNFRARQELSVNATNAQIARYTNLKRALIELREELGLVAEESVKLDDTITALGAGFRSLDDDWSDTVSNLLDGTARVIVQFNRLKPLTDDIRGNLSGLAGGFGLTSQAIGTGRQLGGRGGGILGGALGGGLAGFQLGGPFAGPAAVGGAIIGGLLGLLGGSGGGGRDPRNQLFLRQLPFGGQRFGLEPRGDFRIGGAGAFGGFRISGGSEIDQQFIQGLRQVGFAIEEIDDAIGANLSPDQIRAVTDALEGFEFGGRAGGAQSIEAALRERFTIVFGAVEQGLGDFFESVTGGAGVDEIIAVAEALNLILGDDGVFVDVAGALDEVNILMGDFALAGETLPEVLARVNAELNLLAAAGVDVTDPTTGLARMASDLIEALGGFEAATDAVGRFNAVFSQTTSGLENTADTLRGRVSEAFDELGDTLDPFSLTLDEFNQAFLSVVDGLGAEELADWITAGNALADFNAIMDQLGQNTVDTIDEIQESIKPPPTTGRPGEFPEKPPTVSDFDEIAEQMRQQQEDLLRQSEQQLALMERELLLREELSNAISESLDVTGAWTRANETGIQTLRRTADELTQATLGFDGTVEGLRALQSASGAWRDAALSVLRDIQNAQATIESTVRDSAQRLRLEGQTEEQQYEFFRQQAEALAASLGNLEDPAEIARVVAEIDQLTQSALGIYDPARRAEVRDEVADFLDEVGDIAQRRLEEINQDLTDTGDVFQDTVVPVLEDSFNQFSDSVDVMRATVQAMEEALGRLADAVDTGENAAVVQSQAAALNFQSAQTPIRVLLEQPTINEG